MKKAKQFIVGLLVSITACLSASVFSACKEETTDGTGEAGNQTEQSGGNTETETENKYKNYSEILQNVLTGEYYSTLILIDKATEKSNGERNSYKSAKFNAIPYAFLEDEGYNIDKIKSNSVGSHVNLYTIGNDLFIELKVETKSSIDYYTHYVLKYNLTDQELNELDSLFVPLGGDNPYIPIIRKTYYQAPFFVQELSYQKEAELISKAHMTKDSLKVTEDYFDQRKYNSSTNTVTYVNTNITDTYTKITYHTFQTHKFVDNTYTNGTIKTKAKLSTITFETLGSGCQTVDNNNVFYSQITGDFYLTKEYKQKYEESLVDINLYTCENANFEKIDLEKFENSLAK